MKLTNYQLTEYFDDDDYGQFYILDNPEYTDYSGYNNHIFQQKTRKHKLSDPYIDDLLPINNSSSNKGFYPPIIVRVGLCLGLSCIGFASYCAIYIYSLPYW